MSKKKSRKKQPTEKPFGNANDPKGFWMLLQEQLEYLQVHNYSQSTIRFRTIYVKAFAVWCLERDILQPASVTKPILESYQRYLYRYRQPSGKPLAWSTQTVQLKQVCQFFRYLALHNHIPFNPAGELQFAKQPKQLPKAILSSDEVERVLAQPDTTTPLGIRDRAILEVLYSTGIRRSELCNLRIDHLHVERQALFIEQGKGNKDRYVPIGHRALLWIAHYVENARDQLLLDEKETILFLTNQGGPIQADTLTEYGRHYIRKAGIHKPGSCHIFRHTMATLMLENGADIRFIQSILGHARLETTQIYTRTSLKKLLDVHRRTHPAEQDHEKDRTG